MNYSFQGGGTSLERGEGVGTRTICNHTEEEWGRVYSKAKQENATLSLTLEEDLIGSHWVHQAERFGIVGPKSLKEKTGGGDCHNDD